MKKFLTLATLSAALTASSAFGATITDYFNNLSGFNAAQTLSGTQTFTEGFGAGDSSLFDINFINNSGGSVSPTFQRGYNSGIVNDQVLGNLLVTTIDFNGVANPVYAFGATWDLSPGSTGGSLRLVVNLAGGGTQDITSILGSGVGGWTNPFFFGFVSDQAFTSVTIYGNDGNNPLNQRESYSFDNVLLATAPVVSEVPEPSTFGLMGLALVGLGALRRRRA